MDTAALKQRLAERAELRISDGYFPGCVIGVVWKNGERFFIPAGDHITENSIYDMASVTKSIPTASLLLRLIDEGLIGLDEKVISYIPELSIRERENILVRHLLEFTLDYSNPEYKEKRIKYQSADEILSYLFSSELKHPPGTSYYYTNATAIFTGLLLERSTGRSLDILAEETFFKPLGMTRTNFKPEKFPKEDIVATEIDPWRGREIRGEVHDESAWTLRKEKNMCVGSAGLFSCASDMLTFLEMLLNEGTFNGRKYFSPEMVKQMHTNQLAKIGEHQGLGWKMQRPWMGKRHSSDAFGMTGFTGTSVFCDPASSVGIAILSNGVYPTRERASKENLRDLFRAEIIDMIMEEVQS